MGILKKIAWSAAGVRQKVKDLQADRTRNAEKSNKELLNKKYRYLPQIEKYAKKYGATVEAYDKKAYVYKEIDGRDVGINIAYGEPAATIRIRMERAFTQKPLSSRVLRRVKNAAHRAKEIREELGETGKAIKGAMGDGKGGMYEDPNFGGAFRGSSPSTQFGYGGENEDDEDDDNVPAAPRPPRKRKGGSSGGGRTVSNSLYGNVKLW